jgi:hypothetical protein
MYSAVNSFYFSFFIFRSGISDIRTKCNRISEGLNAQLPYLRCYVEKKWRSKMKIRIQDYVRLHGKILRCYAAYPGNLSDFTASHPRILSNYTYTYTHIKNLKLFQIKTIFNYSIILKGDIKYKKQLDATVKYTFLIVYESDQYKPTLTLNTLARR